MDNLLGLLKVRVKRGLNLAVRDINASDPYVVIKMGDQKLKTRFIHKDCNPVWDEDLTLSIQDVDVSIKLTVYDHDTFTKDDPMGDAEFDMIEFAEAIKMNPDIQPEGTVLKTIQPSRKNCLCEESCIIYRNRKIIQHMFLRLRNVETGEVEIELHWVDIPGSKGL